MGEDQVRLEDETPHLNKVQVTPAVTSADVAAHVIVVHVESESEQTEVGATTPRLEVLLAVEADGSDAAIAERALRALFSAAPLRRERIALRIARGRVTLSGSVATEAERLAAERLIAGIEGVSEVTNLVVVEPHGRTAEAVQGVAEAYGRDAEGGDVAGRIEALFVRQTGWGRPRSLSAPLAARSS